jgi:two-component system nitrogen regulation response regulator GlnG
LPEDLPAELRGAAPTQTVTPTALPHAPAPPAPAAPPPAPATGDIAALVQGLFEWARQDPRRRLLPAVERELVLQALRETGGNQVQAARLLGMTRSTLRKRIERYGIRRQISVQ